MKGAGEYHTTTEQRSAIYWRRAWLRAAGRCVNGPLFGDVGHRGVVHGSVVPNSGGRCQRCLDVKKGSS